jgi:uncharacterized protein YdhG (YjbR/CyaY superfamily)
MMRKSATPTTIDEYIAACPREVQAVLRRIRTTVRKAVPGAQEVISYRMPAFKQNGVLLYFAAFKEHIGVYPPLRGSASLMKRLAPYAGPKGNLRFPLAKRIPYALIGEIVKVRARQNAVKKKK